MPRADVDRVCLRVHVALDSMRREHAGINATHTLCRVMTLIRSRVPRDQQVTLIVQLPACLAGMEACSGAHHWARVFQQHGHPVKLMVSNLVALYRMSGKCDKNDAADAAVI